MSAPHSAITRPVKLPPPLTPPRKGEGKVVALNIRLNHDRQAGPRKMAPFSLWEPCLPFFVTFRSMADTAARLYLITPVLEDASFAPRLAEACATGAVAAVLLRLAAADERALINQVK